VSKAKAARKGGFCIVYNVGMKRIEGSNERGIIKSLVMLTIGICVIFLVLVFLSKSFVGKGSFGNFTLPSPGTTYTGDKTNPLLDFGGQSYTTSNPYQPSGSQDVNRSPYANKVTLSSGSAFYSIQPIEEYIEIYNSGEPVSITGWKLENGKGSRPVEQSNNSYFYPTPDTAIIGQGTEFVDPSGSFTVDPIVLKNGDKAIVTTGGPLTQFSFSIPTSFRENMCLGFLKNYPFEPRVNSACPVITQDKDIRTVTSQCYDYLSSLRRCENPEVENRVRFDEQSSHCKAFVRERQNYSSCVTRSKNLSNFSSSQWRIFLGKKTEMWAERRETITLYDAQGLIVDQITN
jgi:hypothetical protein